MENKNCKLIPLVGIEWNGQTVSFGCGGDAVERVMGIPREKRGRQWFYPDLRVDFDEGERLEFIEFLGGAAGEWSPELFGLDVFRTPAEELCAVLESRAGEAEDEDGGYTFLYPSLSIGLYREVSPADIEQLVRAISRIDLTTLGHVDLAGEQRRAEFWETVGIGKENYYN